MNDSFILVDIQVTVKILSFTRGEVIVKFMEAMALAAKVHGPFSDEVESLAKDLDDVRSGGSLAAYSWLFEDTEA